MRSNLILQASVLLTLALALSAAAQPKGVSPNSLIVGFNGQKTGDGVEASTRNKAFRPIFEKDLARLAQTLPGKPALTISHWYQVINGCAVKWDKGTDETLKKTKEALEKLPYVERVDYDQIATVN